MKCKYFYSFLSAGLLAACGGGSGTDDAALPVLDWDGVLQEAGPLTPTFVEYIPLETNDDCLLGAIDEIIYRDGTYFVLDEEQNKVFLFGEDGSHLFTLDRVGRGPDEYMNIRSMDVDRQGNIYLLSSHSSEVVKYAVPSYARAERFPLQMSALEVAVDESETIWLAEVFSRESAVTLGRYTENGVVSVLEDTLGLGSRSLHYKKNGFCKFPDGLMFNPRYSPYLYRLEDGRAEKVLRLVSRKMITTDELENELDESLTAMPSDRWVFGFGSMVAIGDSLYGRLWSTGSEIEVFKCDRKRWKGSRYKGISRDLPGMGEFFTAADDYIVSYTAATNVIYSLRNTDGRSAEAVTRLKAVAERLDEESNPVLIRFRY